MPGQTPIRSGSTPSCAIATPPLTDYTFISQLENGRGKIPSNRYREWAGALQIDEKIFVKKMLMYYDPHSYEILFGEEAA